MIYIVKSQFEWGIKQGIGSNPSEARRNACIALREDHTLWSCEDDDAFVNEACGIVHDPDQPPILLTEWRNGERIDHEDNPPKHMASEIEGEG